MSWKNTAKEMHTFSRKDFKPFIPFFSRGDEESTSNVLESDAFCSKE
jgi:hypothetical protein